MDFNPVSTKLALLALDASLLRHNAISTNIANSNTAGYSPLRVNFEQQLVSHKQALLNRSMDHSSLSALGTVRPTIEQFEIGATARVSVDMEMVKLNKNTLQYQALLEAMAKNKDIVKMAITEGR